MAFNLFHRQSFHVFGATCDAHSSILPGPGRAEGGNHTRLSLYGNVRSAVAEKGAGTRGQREDPGIVFRGDAEATYPGAPG